MCAEGSRMTGSRNDPNSRRTASAISGDEPSPSGRRAKSRPSSSRPKPPSTVATYAARVPIASTATATSPSITIPPALRIARPYRKPSVAHRRQAARSPRFPRRLRRGGDPLRQIPHRREIVPHRSYRPRGNPQAALHQDRLRLSQGPRASRRPFPTRAFRQRDETPVARLPRRIGLILDSQRHRNRRQHLAP